MATIRKSRKRSAAAGVEPTPRHLWLASLGLIAAARREGIATAECAVARAEAARDELRKAARKAEKQVRDRVDGLRSQVQPAITKGGGEVEARIAPVLGKFGIDMPKARKRPARKARKAPAKAARRTTARKPAKRVARTAKR